MYVNCYVSLPEIQKQLQLKFDTNKIVHSFVYRKEDIRALSNTTSVFFEFEHKLSIQDESLFNLSDFDPSIIYYPRLVESVKITMLHYISKIFENDAFSPKPSRYLASCDLDKILNSEYYKDFRNLQLLVKRGFIQKVSKLLEKSTRKKSLAFDFKLYNTLIKFLKKYHKGL